MTIPDLGHAVAVAHLRRVDPVLGRIIERVGECTLSARDEGTHFDALVRAIVYQQLSGKAAATIHGRLVTRFGGTPPTPKQLVETSEAELRALGLSRQKLTYIKDLAARVISGELAVDRLHELDEEEILAQLVRVKGIGRWTAQMFLMFRLGRPDVLPDLDLGIQKAIGLAYGLGPLATPKQVLEVGARWRPYCTVACWYLWRSLE